MLELGLGLGSLELGLGGTGAARHLAASLDYIEGVAHLLGFGLGLGLGLGVGVAHLRWH